MNRKLSHFLTLLIPTIGFTQGFEKNNLPCIPELCIGDGLSELGKIKCDRAKSDFSITGKPDYVGSRPLPASDVKLVKNVYRGELTRATPYLSYQAFDGAALALLAHVIAACATQELRGTFTSANGSPTTVKIALLSDKKDLAIQRWTVTSISRNFPSATAEAQKIDIRKQLDERYSRFSVKYGVQREIDAIYSIHDDPLLKGAFGVSLSLKVPITEIERERQHPACGGQRKVSID
jgi:hypothetical protein